MKAKLSTKALNLFCKQTGVTLAQIAERLGISYTTINRYSREERFPSIDILVSICNELHIRMNNFLVHPDIEITSVRVFLPEEWSDIVYKPERIEAVRLRNEWSKTEMIRRINECSQSSLTRLTYSKLITGEYKNMEVIVGLLNSTDVDLDYLFEQAVMDTDDDSILIPRKKLQEMKDHISKLENDYRELLVKNKRLEKMALPRYQPRMENKNADKIIREFIRKVERDFADLKGWINEEEVDSSSHAVYNTQDNPPLMVAEPFGED